MDTVSCEGFDYGDYWVSYMLRKSEPYLYGADADGNRGEMRSSVEIEDITVDDMPIEEMDDDCTREEIRREVEARV